MQNDRFRRPAYDYVKRREAGRTGRKLSRMEKVEEAFRSNFERDIRAEIERHERASDEKEHKQEISASVKEQRAWWQFWKGRKPRAEGWD